MSNESTGFANAQGLYQPTPEHGASAPIPFATLAQELAEGGYTCVVGVMDDPNFAGQEVPANLTAAHFEEAWGRIPGVRVVRLEANQIRSYSLLFAGKLDILVFPYGSVYPMEAFWLYSGQGFDHFMKRGGAVLTTGGIPFFKQAAPAGNAMEMNTQEERQAVYDKWVSRFGVKYYELDSAPSHTQVHAALLPSLTDAEFTASQLGVVINNSAHDPVPAPPHGNVFPERYPARWVTPLLTGTDAWGTPLAVNAVLAQDFEHGSRRIHFTHEVDPHPLSPNAPHFPALMADLFALLSNRVMVKDVEADYACYHAGETAVITAELISFEAAPVEITAVLYIASGDHINREERVILTIAPKATVQQQWTAAIDDLDGDEYTVTVTIERDGRTVAEGRNGFLVWQDAVMQAAPAVATQHEYFTFNGVGRFISGTNYYESTRGELMWYRPAVDRVIADFRQMHACGVNYIRPHYHHLKWFKDYLLYQHGRLFDFFSSLESVENPLPDERAWRLWDMFLYLSHKYGIVYGGDLFTLVPAEMGDPRGWFGTVEAVYCLEKRKVQRQFLNQLLCRYRDATCVSWDLFNEPHMIPDEDVNAWAQALRETINAEGATVPITVGGPLSIGNAVDYDSPHGRIPMDTLNTSGRPFLLQELHLDNPEDLASELLQAEMLRAVYIAGIQSGVAGICPWSWTRQMRLWQDTEQHHHTFPMEKWDDRLGLHTHDDGTLKPAGLVFKTLAQLLGRITLQQFDPAMRQVMTTQGTLIAHASDEHERNSAFYHVNGPNCFAAMAKGAICWEGRMLLNGPEDAFLYAMALDDEDLRTSRHLLVRSESSGALVLPRTAPAAIRLVNWHLTAPRVLAILPYQPSPDGLVIEITAEMRQYWIELYWE